jgi:hypothetical protein
MEVPDKTAAFNMIFPISLANGSVHTFSTIYGKNPLNPVILDVLI